MLIFSIDWRPVVELKQAVALGNWMQAADLGILIILGLMIGLVILNWWLGRKRRDRRPSDVVAPAKFLPSYRVETLPDGTLSVVYALGSRKGYFWIFLVCGSWFLGLSILIAGGGGSYPSDDDGFQWYKIPQNIHQPGGWGLGLFMFLGASFILSAISYLACWTEWHIKPGFLEVRYYFLRLPYFVQRYTSSRISLEKRAQHNNEGNNEVTGYVWAIRIHTGRRIVPLRSSDFGAAMPEEIQDMAEVLSRQTGWEMLPLVEVSEDERSIGARGVETRAPPGRRPDDK